MEYYLQSKIANIIYKHPHQLIDPIKPNSLTIPNSYDNLISLANNINQQTHQQIIQAMKNTLFSYQTIFSVERLLLDDPKKQKQEIPKETYETQVMIHEVEKKGFQFFQYSANNPIEDSMCSFQIPQLNAFVVSIFDGHGGSQLSRFCASKISEYLKRYVKNGIKLHKYQNNKIQLIKDGLLQIHSQLENQYYKHYLQKIQSGKKKIKGVGTCAITVVIYENKCIVATCGDSQAIAVSSDRGSYNYQKLSERYSVSNKAERQRITQQFKQIDDKVIVQQRKNVFYLKGMLQPTKSIGDYYLKHKEHYIGQDQFKGPYLSCEPDIKVYDIKQHDQHIVVASDGLWDYLNKWQIVKCMVQAKNDKINISQRQTQSQNQDERYPTTLQSSKYLAQKILQKVSNDFDFDINYLKSLQLGERRSYHDDITIGIIDLKEFFQFHTQKN